MDVFLEFAPMVFSGLWITVLLSLSSLALAIVFGLIGAGLKQSQYAAFRFIGGAYTTLIRGIPDLVLMLIIFFGGQIALNELGKATGMWTYIEINQFAAGTFTIGFIFGAYMTETFRGAFMAIPRGQAEAARALGMRTPQYLPLVIFPQLVPIALPSFTNNWLVLLKTTALVSIIGLQDVIYNANQASRTTKEPFLFLTLAFFIYLGLTMISDIGLKRLNARYSRHLGGRHGV